MKNAPTEVYAIIRKATGELAWDRAIYADATRAKIALRSSARKYIGDYTIVRIGGAVNIAWDTDANGKWTEVSADADAS
jgi:hypothetical protein